MACLWALKAKKYFLTALRLKIQIVDLSIDFACKQLHSTSMKGSHNTTVGMTAVCMFSDCKPAICIETNNLPLSQNTVCFLFHFLQKVTHTSTYLKEYMEAE